MSDLDLNQVLSLRYRTSQEADGYTDKLRQYLALATKAQVARLAIGRSLAMGALPDVQIDSKGMDIPAQSLFSPENIGAWIGLLVTHARATNWEAVMTQDSLRSAIRAHWHRGAVALWNDWTSAEDYDSFIATLVRRSEMPDFSGKPLDVGAESESTSQSTGPLDASAQLTKALDELGIKIQIKEVIHGPRLTRYRVLLLNLADLGKLNRSIPQLGLAMNLGRTEATVSNGDEPKTIFIDLPRPRSTWESVSIQRLRSWAQTAGNNANKLLLYAGVSVTGDDVSFDLSTAPHVLVGGTTGSGKSVCLHSFILSLLMMHRADSLQLALIDPKQVEFKPYERLGNLYRGGIATEAPAAREMLTELVSEMEARYSSFNRLGVANILDARKKGQKMPYIVAVVEELADLVMVDKNIEPLLERLAQKARAAGIHLILATQRPDSDTFSGLIRGNVPCRVALTVQKGTESTIILDEKGAESLLGQGDMLIKLQGEAPRRAHGVLVQTENIVQLVSSLAKG
ncbi:FtsK/SpoIIIE domain-containing protein [Burkholderia ambifaria]|uniref:FtsK/SpoIIIE domain-containing protein n=1 Tax=Burkholderia ambifaria TaxID=152480 RepID=UPI001589E1A8|nr:FtsK/SpoIIIE domain-containing protein [Burkholderia ambifaria]